MRLPLRGLASAALWDTVVISGLALVEEDLGRTVVQRTRRRADPLAELGQLPAIVAPPRPEGLFYALLKLQDKIDQMSLAKRPTEVRLHPEMVEQFKRNVMVAQTPTPR